MSTEPIIEALAALGIEWERNEGDVLIDALVIGRISNPEGGSTVLVLSGPGMDFVVQTGLIECARQITLGDWTQPED